MAVRTIIVCDRCEQEGAQNLALDLGTGAAQVDLCDACQKDLGLVVLRELLVQHGVTQGRGEVSGRKQEGRAGKRRPDNAWECPVCGVLRNNRTMMIRHLESIHSMSRVESSQAVPPRGGRKVECEVCGFITQAGTGYAAHVSSTHGEGVWADIRDRIKESVSS